MMQQEISRKLTLGWTLVAALAVGLVGGCASDAVKKSDDVEAIYNRASELIKKERYIEATEYITEIRTRFPQSRFAQLAELRLADMAFDQNNYTESAAAYGTFAELYPRHAETPYALYRRALSFYNDSPDNPSRDQAPARDAAVAAQVVVAKFPASEFTPKAQDIYRQARTRLAQKEAYVAHYYEKRGATLAAFRRWENLQRDFGELKGSPEGDAILAEAGEKLTKLSPAAKAEQSKIESASAE